MAGSIVLGYIGAIIASIFFGSNYVPTKKYPTGDGFSFVWVFASGVMCVGFVSIFINGEAVFVPTGILGGSLWALGNLCVIPIVQSIGLGLGMLIWGGTSLITGFFSGKFGFFGLNKDAVSHDSYNWGGIACILCALIVFFFIKPELDANKHKYKTINAKEIPQHPQHHEPDEESHTPHHEHEPEETKLLDFLPRKSQPVVGCLLAVFSGILYGVNIVPMKLWSQNQDPQPKPLAFVLSQFMGIYLFSTFVYIIYNLVKRPPQIFPEGILPSFISGAMWGIAQCGLMMATQILGFTVGFPIGSTGPLVVSSFISVVFFREIRGAKNLSLLFLSFALLGAGVALLSLSFA